MTLSAQSPVSRTEWTHLKDVVAALGYETARRNNEYCPNSKKFRVTIRSEGGFGEDEIERIKQQGWDIIEVDATVRRNVLYSKLTIERLKKDVLNEEVD